MQHLKTIFSKELKDTLRDRRTMITMVFVPLLIFPLIFYIGTTVSKSFAEDAMEEALKVGVQEKDSTSKIVKKLKQLPDKQVSVVYLKDTAQYTTAIRDKKVNIALYEPENQNEEQKIINIYLNEAEIEKKQQIDMLFETLEEDARKKKLIELNITEQQIHPLRFDYVDIASKEEKLGKIAGGILPYMFIIFCFMGCMYPCIDLFTGEKERGTIETILSTPVQRTELLFGKMGVVVLSGLLAATLSMVGLFLGIQIVDLGAANEIKGIVYDILSFQFILAMYMLLIPLTVFFAGIMIPLSLNARSFKEAQSIITPLNIVVILPAMIGFLPGIEYNIGTALVPIVNIVLATKEIIAGTIEYYLLAISFVELLLIAFVAVWVSKFQYAKENNIV